MSFRMPSTPNKRSLQSQPSTTPAGPPPSYLTNKSTTPSGPPPRSTFNSSYLPSNNTFGSRGNGAHEFDYGDDDDADYEYDKHDQADGVGFADARAASRTKEFMGSTAANSSSLRGLKRSHDGQIRERSDMDAIALSMIDRSQPAPLREDGKILIAVDEMTTKLDRVLRTDSRRTAQAVGDLCARSTELWTRFSDQATKSGALGPASKEAFTRATYLASLLIQLHYPHAQPHGELGDVSFERVFRDNLGSASHLNVPMPRALLSWLDKYHQPFPDDFETVYQCRPSPSAHESFWDIIFASALRGKLSRVVQLLRHAHWEHAFTAQDDGSEGGGYDGVQLQNTEEVAARAAKVIGTCPGLEGDWDIKNNDWGLFRQHVNGALHDLAIFAGADTHQSRSGENMFARSMGESGFSLSTSSRRAESRVPWSVFENLSLLYKLLLGHEEDILLTSQDWLEASLYLTIWWDGSDNTTLAKNMDQSTMRKSVKQRPREVDLAPLAAYQKRLGSAFARVTEEPDDSVFAVNTLELVEVGLACIMEDSVATTIGVLRALSMPVAISVIEIALAGDWLPLARPTSRGHLLGQGFSREDLLVLSHGPEEVNPKGVDRDKLLSEYANLLAQQTMIVDKEGWELAIGVLSREDNVTEATKEISVLLDGVTLSSEVNVNRVLAICDNLSLTEQRMNIAERYADSLAEDGTAAYGPALIYYARAQATTKLRRTLELLTSLSLLHSASMPTRNSLDATLESLISKERLQLKSLAMVDLEAATLLSSQLSGYATLRRFYDLRDEGLGDGQELSSLPSFRSLERQRQAANALFTVIQSAADCIPGGLYDREAESVVSVEGLLVLFGEALPLLGQKQRIFTQQQVFALLGAVEDYTASPSRIHENAGSLLAASLTAYDSDGIANSGSLRKMKSDMSASSSWDMIASQSLIMQKSEAAGNAQIRRAWDWRKGLVAVNGISSGGEQVIALLREALAREVAHGWAGMLNW